MTLADYVKQHELSDDAFSDLIGVDRASVSRMRRGLQIPSADTMRKIADVTGGLVTPNDFFGIAA